MKKAKPKVQVAKPERQPNQDAINVLALARQRLEGRPRRPDFSAKRNKQTEETFLEGLRMCWSVSRSAWAAGIHESSAYNWRNASLASKRDDGTLKDDFATRWDEAFAAGVDTLEEEAIRRARDGVEKPVYQGGLLVGAVQEYSDTLMGLVLRGKKPDTYNTERHEHTGADGGAIQHNLQIEFVNAPKDKKS